MKATAPTYAAPLGNDQDPEPSPRRPWRPAALLGVLVTLITIGAVSPAPRSDRSPAAARLEPGVKGEVRSVLSSMRGTWSWRYSWGKADVSDHDRGRYEPVLAEYLADPADPLFRQAVQLAVRQGQKSLLPQLRAALENAPDEATGRLLVESIDELEPWSEAELRELIRSDSPAVVVAALGLAAARLQLQVEDILDRLVDPVPAIRAAALAAAPAEIPAAVGMRIATAMRHVPAEQAGEALAALARCPATAEVEEILYSHVEGRTEHCNAVLAALAGRATPLTRPESVLRLARDPSAPMRTRGRALRCLEATATTAGIESLELTLQHPALDYCAARVLLRAKRPRAVDVLLDIVRAPDVQSDDVEPLLAQEARIGARQILAALSDTGVYTDVAEWTTWWGWKPELRTDRVPPSTVTLD